ncbi:hypothetical protein DJ71_08540 [Halorubrum sp. E3]|nr:hypothetical protein DJ71_08540 [Halorubrum sp. E3]OYR87279.1 hypothetical protein DJ72_01540 [Halorubrum distributum]
MPTLNSYADDPGYFIRAWTPELSNINYKLKPSGWKIIDDWEELSDGDEITWKHINVLKSAGVVYTEDTGVIYPDDEEFQPDPDQVSSVELSEDDARAFIETILSHCDLSPEQVAELYQMLDVEPHAGGGDSEYSGIPTFLKSELRDKITSGSLPLDKTLSGSSEDLSSTQGEENKVEVTTFIVESSWKPPESSNVQMDKVENTLGLLITESEPDTAEPVEFVLHQIFFNDDNIIAWTAVTSKQASWMLRSELFGQISTLLPRVIVGLDRGEVAVWDDLPNFEIEFYHDQGTLSHE